MALEHWNPGGPGIVPFLESGETRLGDWERKSWGITNAEAAEKILVSWRMPHETVSAIRHHYEPAAYHNPLIHMLALAAAAAADICYAIPGEAPYWQLTSKTFAKAGLEPSLFPIVCEKAERKFAELNLVVE
jgi:HD-like signal output (HDOD) protein